MKKLASAIPVAGIIGILTFLFVFMCLPEKQSGADTNLTVSFHFLRTRGLNAVVLGGILMAAFYHLTLYIFRRRDTVYLFFSCFCVTGAMTFIFTRGGLNDVFGWLSAGVFLTRFNGILSFIYHNTITILGLHVLHRRFLLAHRRALAVYIVLGFAYYLLVPVSAPFYRLVPSLVIIVVSLFVTVIGFRSPALRENRWTWLYFISFILLLGSGIINILIFPGLFYMLGLVSNLFMVLSQSVLLSKNYANAFQFAEETNLNLEHIVDERTKSLQSMNNAMKELVSNISHDLKTPLAIMSLNLETLSGLAVTQSNAEYQRHVRTAYQKNRDLQRLIGNLFEVSRIETGRNLYSPKWESLLHILAQAKEKYDAFLEDNGIFFDITVEDDIEISTDPQKVWSVFDNIIYNAAHHTESGGIITITAHNTEQTAAVTITDTGCGIAAEHLPYVFERFYRASAARSASQGESGLGLYIVKSIMEGCGGSAKAESVQGKGTSILLTFPARKKFDHIWSVKN